MKGVKLIEQSQESPDTFRPVPATGSGKLLTEDGAATVTTKAAAGANQGAATAIPKGGRFKVTDADGAKGVRLPAAVAGLLVEIYNESASALLVYPASGDDINDGTADVAVSVAANSHALFMAVDAATWAARYAAAGTAVTLTGAETLTNKTLTTPTITERAATFAAAGADQSGAVAITTAAPGIILVSGADGAKGAKLPAAAAGLRYQIVNGANAVLLLYPASGDAINQGAANAAISIGAYGSLVVEAYDATTWYTTPKEPGVLATQTGTETFTNKTLTQPTITERTATVAADGTLQADATAITTPSPCLILVSGADAAKGVKLPAAAAGIRVKIKNGANAVLKVWPASGDAINETAADGSITMGAYTCAEFEAYDATTWYSTPRVPS